MLVTDWRGSTIERGSRVIFPRKDDDTYMVEGNVSHFGWRAPVGGGPVVWTVWVRPLRATGYRKVTYWRDIEVTRLDRVTVIG